MDLGNGGAADNIVFAREGTTNTLSFHVYNGSTSGGRVTAAEAIPVNQGQMLTATLDEFGNVRLYRNGDEVARGRTAVPRNLSRTSSYVGRSNWSSDAYFQGSLDDLAVWSRPLTPDEVAAAYTRGAAGRSFVDDPDPEAPAAWWPLNEGAGLETADASGGGQIGALIGLDAAAWTAGKQCGGLTLDGVDDHVIVPGCRGITGKAARTCAAWIRTSAAQQGHILSWGDEQNGRKWLFRVDAAGTLSAGVWGGYAGTTATVNDGRWHHVAAVVPDDGSPSVNEIRFYIDGVLQASQAYNTMAIDTAADQDVIIGALDAGGGALASFFSGSIDDVRIYNRALAADQVWQLYDAYDLIADLEPDGAVDLGDLAVLAAAWQRADACDLDLTCDCLVTLDDLAVLTEEWLGGGEGGSQIRY